MNSWPQGAIQPLGGTPNRPLIGSADVRGASGTPAKFVGYPARLAGACRPLGTERSGGLNGYAKNGMGDGAGHAASFLVLTGGKGAKTVEAFAKAGK